MEWLAEKQARVGRKLGCLNKNNSDKKASSTIPIARLKRREPWFPQTTKNSLQKYDFGDEKRNRDFKDAAVYYNQMSYKLQNDPNFLPRLKANIN